MTINLFPKYATVLTKLRAALTNLSSEKNDTQDDAEEDTGAVLRDQNTRY